MIDDPRSEIARELDANREELRALLEGRARPASAEDADRFPRSRFMRSLMDPRVVTGLAVLGIAAMALKPELAARVLRKVPVKLLATRLLTSP